MELRDYQIEAINKCALELTRVKKTMIVAPTGSGKSVIIAGICDRFLSKPKNENKRILILCHTAEILMQNMKQLELKCPFISKTFYCAALGQKDLRGQIILASRDSIGRLENMPQFELVLCDEAHLLNTKSNSMYMRVLDRCQYDYVVGFSGTPWRLDNGVIYGKGKGRFFETCCYNIEMRLLVERGFLVPYVTPEVETIDLSGVKIVNHDYEVQEMERRFSNYATLENAVKQWCVLASDRLCTIFFCCSVKHAELTKAILKKYGHESEMIIGETEKSKRKFLIEHARHGNVKVFVSVNAMSTGLDIPICDCIVWLRGTKSASLYLQGSGRALRTYPGKKDALILDFAGNFSTFGSLEEPIVSKAGKKEMTEEEKAVLKEMMLLAIQTPTSGPNTKNCPKCMTEVFINKVICYCGYVFKKLEAVPHNKKIMLQGEEWFPVSKVEAIYTTTKSGEPCYKIDYHLQNGKTISEWIMYKRLESWLITKYHKRKKQISTGIISIKAKKNDNGYYNIQDVKVLTNPSSSDSSRVISASHSNAVIQQASIIKSQISGEKLG